jgi:PBSX family phage terminase large subunit
MIEIPYYPNEYQIPFHLDESRFRILVGGRRVGKSLSALHDMLKHCLATPGAVAWWISPTLTDARDVGWEILKDLLPQLEIVVRYINETRMKICFSNGAVITFKGSENERSLRGRGLTFLVVDEGAFIEPSVWKKALRPALTDKQGRAVLCSTPNGRNWYFDQFNYAKISESWSTYSWPTYLNPIITKEDLLDAQEELSDIEYRQEYLAEFITKAGMVYDDFTDDNIIQPYQPNRQSDLIYAGMDFGYAGYTAICFMALDNNLGTVRQFDEIYVSRHDIQNIAELIKTKLAEYQLSKQDLIALYTDPAGNAEELTSGISPVDYLRMNHDFNIVNKGSLIVPGLALVRSYIKTASGKRRFFISSNCTESIRSMRGYSYEGGKKNSEVVKEEPLKDGINDHMCDAIRYFFVNRFDHSKWVAKSPEQNNYLAHHKKQTIMKRCSICRNPFVSSTPKEKPPFACNKCKEKEVNGK